MRRVKRAGLWVVAASATIFFAAELVHLMLYAPEAAITPPASVAEAAPALAPRSIPLAISIPAIAVDAKIDPLGIVAGGRMQAPANFTDVGWYKYGVAPGAPGVAVLYAHLDNGLGLSGVFKNLDELQRGDEIDITNASGQVLRFAVSDIETYPYQSVPPAALGESPIGLQSGGPARIVLITCAGAPTHDPSMGYTYDHRLLVSATLLQ